MASKMFDFKKLSEKLFSPKGTKILLVVGFIGIALIALSSFLPSGGKKSSAASSSTASGQSDAAYASELQSRLQKIISQINGVGRVDVMITFSSGTQYVYEQNQKQTTNKSSQSQDSGTRQTTENTDNEQQPVIVSGNSGEQQPIVKTQISPEVKGVVVVCDGADSPTVQESIINAVSTALSLDTNHVCVIKRAQS